MKRRPGETALRDASKLTKMLIQRDLDPKVVRQALVHFNRIADEFCAINPAYK